MTVIASAIVKMRSARLHQALSNAHHNPFTEIPNTADILRVAVAANLILLDTLHYIIASVTAIVPLVFAKRTKKMV